MQLGNCPACGGDGIHPDVDSRKPGWYCWSCGVQTNDDPDGAKWNALCEMAAKARAWDAEMAALKPMGLTRTRKLLAVSMERKRGGLDV